MTRRWEIWRVRTDRQRYWLERPLGRHAYCDFECVASFVATEAEARRVLELLRGDT